MSIYTDCQELRCMARKLIEDHIAANTKIRIAIYPTPLCGLPMYLTCGQPVIVSPFNVQIYDRYMKCVVTLGNRDNVLMTYRCEFLWDKIMAVELDGKFINTLVVVPITLVVMENGDVSFTELMKSEISNEINTCEAIPTKYRSVSLSLIRGGKSD